MKKNFVVLFLLLCIVTTASAEGTDKEIFSNHLRACNAPMGEASGELCALAFCTEYVVSYIDYNWVEKGVLYLDNQDQVLKIYSRDTGELIEICSFDYCSLELIETLLGLYGDEPVPSELFDEDGTNGFSLSGNAPTQILSFIVEKYNATLLQQ